MSENGSRKWPETLSAVMTLAAGVWLVVAGTILAIAATSDFDPEWPTVTYLVLTVLASPVCFIAYGIDRRRTAKDQPRLTWRALHLPALLGGWPGALLGRSVFRRQGETMAFRLFLWVIVALHVAIMLYTLYGYLFPAKPE
jgi:uncharacterized membrane protein YsdA (DUF1294 family)